MSGRTGQFSDILIDTIGGIIGCIFHYLFGNLINKKGKMLNNKKK